LELRGVTKDFVVGLRGVRLRAVDKLNLTVPSGEIFGLLGSNGSGKSTTLKIILGFIAPTSGSCAIFGVPCARPDARVAVGYLPESPDFYRYLTGRELVVFYGQLAGMSGKHVSDAAASAIEQVGMTSAADRRVGTYSKGMLQRIGLAQAIVHEPKLLILDEPTAGVDSIAASAISELLLTLKKRGTTIVITSHLLGQIEELCDRVAILDRGRLLVEGRLSELIGEDAKRGLWLASMSSHEQEELDRWLGARGYPASNSERPRVRLDEVLRERVTGRNRPECESML
jgi:ABC-2 type transport system ATP-binding protein